MKLHAKFYTAAGPVTGPSSILTLSPENSNGVNLVLAEDHARKLGVMVTEIQIVPHRPGLDGTPVLTSYVQIPESQSKDRYLNIRPFVSDLCESFEEQGFELDHVEYGHLIVNYIGTPRRRRQDLKLELVDKWGACRAKKGSLFFLKDEEKTEINFDFASQPENFFYVTSDIILKDVTKALLEYRKKALAKLATTL